MKRAIILGVLLPAFALPAFGASATKTRKKIGEGSTKALERLFTESPDAKAPYDRSFVYATFDGTEAALLISSGGGKGVAVEKTSGKRVYVRVASAGQEGMNAKSSFIDGMMVFQMTKNGLVAQASVKGTKYWKDEKLNES